MGASVSYSGELIENINSFAYEGNQLYGYEKNYNQTYAQEREKLTSSGFPKMDLVLFSFHHSLGGLVDQKALSMELSIHKVHLYPFFPPLSSILLLLPSYYFYCLIILIINLFFYLIF